MDSLQLPQYIIDLERASRDVPFGEVGPFYLKRAGGETVGMRGQTTNEIRFKSTDESLLYIVDILKSLPPDKTGEITLKVGFTNGVVKKITNITDMTTKYGKEG